MEKLDAHLFNVLVALSLGESAFENRVFQADEMSPPPSKNEKPLGLVVESRDPQETLRRLQAYDPGIPIHSKPRPHSSRNFPTDFITLMLKPSQVKTVAEWPEVTGVELGRAVHLETSP